MWITNATDSSVLYYEDGTTVRGEINYSEDFGRYTEYDQAGKVLERRTKDGNATSWALALLFSAWRNTSNEGRFEENNRRNGEWLITRAEVASKARMKMMCRAGKGILSLKTAT